MRATAARAELPRVAALAGAGAGRARAEAACVLDGRLVPIAAAAALCLTKLADEVAGACAAQRGAGVQFPRILEAGGLFSFGKALRSGELKVETPDTSPRPMTMAEKVLASHVFGAGEDVALKPGDLCLVNVDGGYSHEFTTAEVHTFLQTECGADYTIPDASKFAVLGVTQATAMDLAPYGITVNAVCPGPINTDRMSYWERDQAEERGISQEEFRSQIVNNSAQGTPLGRIAESQDVANMVAFLAGDDASFITGQSYNVNGGQLFH